MQGMQVIPVPVERKNHSSISETIELIEKTGQFRMLGFTFLNIGKALGISEAQACRHFKKWAFKHRQDWEKEKGNEFVRIRETFSKRLAEAERNYETAKAEKNSPAMAVWHKLGQESLKEYTDFLTQCGYLIPEIIHGMANREPDEVEALVASYRDYLKEVVALERNPKPDTPAT
jgi:hypothetical protein